MDPLEAAALIAAGLAIGIYATAIGVGGGFLFTPLLLARHPDVPPEFVTTASLGIVAISSGLSTLFVARERRIDYPVVGLLAGVAIPGAIVGAAGTALVPRDVFAIGVSVLLLVIAAYLAWQPRATIATTIVKGWSRRVADREGNVFVYRFPPWRSVAPIVAASALSALAGIGGGIMYVPLTTRVMRMPHALAVPAAHVVIVTLATTVVAVHLAAGDIGEPLRDLPWLAVGVLLGNPIGRRVLQRMGEGPLMRLLAVGLLLVSARTAWGAF